ncbi:MAG: hypothetical protein EBR82_02885 [Caulobacteraceae bacterium]|nr:hypothetical protein [Caulobacteraceae bacterium]
MSPAAMEELRLCQAACEVERAHLAVGARAYNAEAFQRALWWHRGEILGLVAERPAIDALVDDLLTALRPFGRVASILAPGQNPVLFSIPVEGARTFVQLRPADFRLAAELTRLPA